MLPTPGPKLLSDAPVPRSISTVILASSRRGTSPPHVFHTLQAIPTGPSSCPCVESPGPLPKGREKAFRDCLMRCPHSQHPHASRSPYSGKHPALTAKSPHPGSQKTPAAHTHQPRARHSRANPSRAPRCARPQSQSRHGWCPAPPPAAWSLQSFCVRTPPRRYPPTPAHVHGRHGEA
eukprot:366341-Chlamydomonas_euryale.AAC.13